MTMEEKAKLYDEAIERANELNYVSDKDSLQRKTVEHIFPELTESNDERIRKELIFYFQEEIPQCSIQEHADKMKEFIAWLEKQREQKPAWSEEDEKYLKLAIDNFQTLGNSFLTTWLKALKDRVQPQQKQEWSEEDKKILNYLLWFYDTRFRWNDTCNGDIKFGDIVTFLKSLRLQNRWKPSDEQMHSLKQAINAFPYETDYLELLYEQLKKLMEE